MASHAVNSRVAIAALHLSLFCSASIVYILARPATSRSTTSSSVPSRLFLRPSSSFVSMAVGRRRPARRGSKRKNRELSSLSVESDLRSRGYRYVIGSDESGRGSIAGPVVTASCCILPEDLSTYDAIRGVDDSKALDPTERERIYQRIIDRPDSYAWNVSMRSNEQIDESDVLKATMACFAECVEELVERFGFSVDDAYSIIDGKKNAKLTGRAKGLTCRPWVKADSEVYTVALASIIAKVTRDRIMAGEAHELYPLYGFDENKGYSTKDHIIALHTHGPCPLHRMSFKALKNR